MGRISIILAVATALAVATFAGLWAGGSGRPAHAAPSDGLKCYKVSVLDSDRQGVIRYIQDQFEGKDTILKKPIDFCSRSLVSFAGQSTEVSAGSAEPSDLTCYGIKDVANQPRFVQQTIGTEDRFNVLTLQLTKPLMVCEPAEKLASGPGGAQAAGTDALFEFKCYSVRRVENGEEFHLRDIGIDDQFLTNGKEVQLGRPVVFCTQVAAKKVQANNDRIQDADTLVSDQEVDVSTISMHSERHEPTSECGRYSHSIWFTYTPGEDVGIKLGAFDSTFKPLVAIYTGKPGSLNEVTCDAGGIKTKLEGSTKYFILVASLGNNPGGKLKLELESGAKGCSADFESDCTGGVSVGDGSAAGPDLQDNLVCYSIGVAGPHDTVIETKDQITFNKMKIGRQDLYCTPAGKCLEADNLSAQTIKCKP